MDSKIKNIFEIDGFNCSGINAIVCKLQENIEGFIIKEGNTLSGLLNIYPDDLPYKLATNTIFIVIDQEIEEAISQLKFEKQNYEEIYSRLFKERNRYRRLAIRYQIFFVETNKISSDEVYRLISLFINNPLEYSKVYIIPNPDNYTS